MNPKQSTWRWSSFGLGLWFLILLASAAALRAAEAPLATGISGLWMWSLSSQNGQTVETTVRLKVEDGKLTGAMPGARERDQPTPIKDGKINGEDVSFTLTKERDGQEYTATYTGKLSGNTIKGRMQFTRDGETRSRSWEATRQKDTPPPRPQGFFGEWRYSVTISEGDKIDLSLNLRREKDEWLGVVKFGDVKLPISDVQKDGLDISFKVVWDRDGEKHTSKYSGHRDGDTIKGKIESDFGGQNRTFEWLAKRP